MDPSVFTSRFELPSATYADQVLLQELKPKIIELHSRHLSVAKTWDPSDLITPVQEARLSGECDPRELPLSETAASSVTLGYLTEEGLPYYTLAILKSIPPDHPFAEWARRWTAEEGRHGLALFGVLWAAGVIDMRKLETDRMVMMEKGDTPQPESFAEISVYPTPQEKATRLNHNGSGRLLPAAYKAVRQGFTTIAGDENLHFNFYNDLSSEGFKIEPSAMTIATARQFINFTMPGRGIPGYFKHAVRISNAAIYGMPEQEDIFKNLIDEWGIYSLPKLTSDAEYARDALSAYMTIKLAPDAERSRQKRQERKAKREQEGLEPELSLN